VVKQQKHDAAREIRVAEYQVCTVGVLIGVGSRRRSASQAIDLPVNGGGTLGRLITRAGEHLIAIPKRYRLGRADRQHEECRAACSEGTT
jgi:hypothetical protein